MPTATTLASPMLRPEGVLIGSVGLNGTRQTLWISSTPGARISEKGVFRTHRGCWFGAVSPGLQFFAKGLVPDPRGLLVRCRLPRTRQAAFWSGSVGGRTSCHQVVE